MRNRSIARAFLVLACIFTFNGAVQAADETKAMLHEAKVDRDHANLIALARVHGGKIKSTELKREHDGRLVWSCEITIAGRAEPTNVLVNAHTGKIVAVHGPRATTR